MALIINIITTMLLIPWGGIIIMSPMMIAAQGFRDSRSSILSAMAIISYPVLIFALLKVLGFQFFGTNLNGWLIGSALIAAIVILVYGLPGLLLNLLQGISNSGYFVGKSTVYLDGKRVKGADPRNFEALEIDFRYAKDKSHVFYYGKVIEFADPETFTAVDPPVDEADRPLSSNESPVYWKDTGSVYYSGKIVEHVDTHSFIHFAGLYAKDNSHVYYQDRLLLGADPDKFRFIKYNSIATDGINLFIYRSRSKVVVDVESFEVIENENDTFCKDNSSVYLLFYHQDDPLVKVEGADLPTFKPLERKYAVDKNYVWFYGYYERNIQKLIRLEGADPCKFTVGYNEVTNSEASDGERYYLYGREVKPGK